MGNIYMNFCRKESFWVGGEKRKDGKWHWLADDRVDLVLSSSIWVEGKSLLCSIAPLLVKWQFTFVLSSSRFFPQQLLFGRPKQVIF